MYLRPTNPQLGKTPKWVKKLEPRRWFDKDKKVSLPSQSSSTTSAPSGIRDEQPHATQTSVVPQTPTSITYLAPTQSTALPGTTPQAQNELLRASSQDAMTRSPVRIVPVEFGPYVEAAYSDDPAQTIPREFVPTATQTKPVANWALIIGIASLLLMGN